MTKLKVLTILLVLCQLVTAQNRREVNLKTWEFSRDKTSWTQVDIPHDWAIAGPFDKKWDLQRVAITQNGETEATEKSGRSGALPWIGEGWYRTSVDVPAGYEAAELVFDGAMSEPRVSVNGDELRILAGACLRHGAQRFYASMPQSQHKDWSRSLT